MGQTALFAAESMPAVGLLVVAGADIEARDENGNTPLTRAAYDGREAVVKYLLLEGAEKDSISEKMRTPLHWAAEQGHSGVVRLLANVGADRGAIDVQNQTPRDIAMEEGHQEIADILQWFKEKSATKTLHDRVKSGDTFPYGR